MPVPGSICAPSSRARGAAGPRAQMRLYGPQTPGKITSQQSSRRSRSIGPTRFFAKKLRFVAKNREILRPYPRGGRGRKPAPFFRTRESGLLLDEQESRIFAICVISADNEQESRIFAIFVLSVILARRARIEEFRDIAKYSIFMFAISLICKRMPTAHPSTPRHTHGFRA